VDFIFSGVLPMCQSVPPRAIGGFMRSLLCALLLAGSVFAQDASPDAAGVKGSFYVDGILYRYAASANYTVVAATHSAINRKFFAVKVRVYNTSPHSVTVTPDGIRVEDAAGGQAIAAISGADLAQKMRKPYNMARYTVGGVSGAESEPPITSDMLSPQFLQMMRAMAARTNGGAMPSGKNVLYTDTPGALDEADAAPSPADCDQVCRLHNRETQGADPLAQLQHGATPDYVENATFRANTIAPRGNVAGVLYYPMGKLSATPSVAEHGKKGRMVRVMVPVMGEKFEFALPVE
jgi:hypothetical protein